MMIDCRNIRVRVVGIVAIVDIVGKVLLNDGDRELGCKIDELVGEGKNRIVINLAKVTYIDSFGLQKIIRGYQLTRKSGGKQVLLSPNQRIIDLLTITKLINVFDWYQDELSAIAALQ